MVERDLAADDPAGAVHVRAADDPVDDPAAVDLVAGALAGDVPVAVAVDPHRNRRTMVKSRVSRFKA